MGLLLLYSDLWYPLHTAWVRWSQQAPLSHLKVPGELEEQRDGLAGSDPQVHTFAGQQLGQPGQLPGEGAN